MLVTTVGPKRGVILCGEVQPGLLLGEEPRTPFTVDVPAGEADRLLLESLVGIGAMEREPEKNAEDAAHQQHVLGAHNEELDLSEYTDASFWGNTFKSGPFPVSMWQDKRIYTHAVVRDPVERLISAYANKLSCGLYSVPAGQRGDRGDTTFWQQVVEPGSDELYGAGFLEAANMGIGLQTFTVKVPCRCENGRWWDWTQKSSRHCDDTNFTVVTCRGMSLETYADALLKIYRAWPQHRDEDLRSASRRFDVHLDKLNGHW